MVLGFYEMLEKDRPPRDIWLDEESLALHFEQIKNDHSGVEAVPDMMQNELTKGLR